MKPKMQNQKNVNIAMKEVKAEIPITASPIVKGEALKAKLAKTSPTPSVTTTVAQPKLREVVEWGKRAVIQEKPAEQQSDYESRSYMRNMYVEKPDANTVTHITSHTTSMIFEKAIEYMQGMYLKRSPANSMFKSGELSETMKTYGPARTDIIRNAMKKLAKDGKVKVHKVVQGKVVRYTFELLELPVVPQTQAPAA